MFWLLAPAWFAAALVAAATCRHVWRGGRTWNDHIVAALVSACIAVYPTLWTLAVHDGLHGTFLGALLLPGPLAIYGLFYALDLRREPPRFWRYAGIAAQPAMAFSLWCGLLLFSYLPFALVSGRFWPGWWLVMPVGLTGWGTVWTYWRGLRVFTHVVQPASAGPDAIRLVQLSDIHASPLMDRHDIRQIVNVVRQLNPDVVAVTGDHLMPFSEAEHAYLIEELSRIEAPVVACLGNHDLPVADRLVAEFAAAGMRLLVDEACVLSLRGQAVEFVGVNFHWKNAEQHLLRALESLPPPSTAIPRILLAHDPRLFRWVPSARFNLVLSGHTHGGQVGTDMFGIPGSVLGLFGLYDQGRFERDNTILYVHRGNWHTGLPPRMGIAAEIVLHTLPMTTANGANGVRLC